MMHRLGVQAAVVLGLFTILGNRSIEVGQEGFLDFPVIHLSTDAKLEILLGNRVPILWLS